MTHAILVLTAIGICAILYSRWRSKQATKLEVLHEELQAQIAETKKEVEAATKEAQDAGTDYNVVYDAYKRKYGKSPRDNQ